MPNLSKSKKSQFFILTAISIVLILSIYVRVYSPKNTVFVSEILTKNEFFTFNNILEKSIKLFDNSKDCDDLKFGMEEFKKVVQENYPFYKIEFSYDIKSCDSSSAQIEISLFLKSIYGEIGTKLNRTKNW
ncbi:MAG: hypothetical protein N3D78_00385 [Candidatus Aenigmarchaeota archaeon]|nr:hypothetical protein [Candidatus Aenigmarchaeota archaeon]